MRAVDFPESIMEDSEEIYLSMIIFVLFPEHSSIVSLFISNENKFSS